MRRILPLALSVVAVIVVAGWLDALPTFADGFPEPLRRTYAGVEVWRWLGLAIALGTAILGATVARTLAVRLTRLRDRLVGVTMSNEVRNGLARAAFVIALGLMASVLFAGLALPSRFDQPLAKTAEATTIVGVVLLVLGLWDAFSHAIQTRAAGHQRAERLLVPMVRKLVQAIVFVTGLLAVMAVFISPERLGALVAGLGVGGIVVALAAKDSVENLFGSITIMLDMPFAIGDEVRIDKIEGTVEEINLRSTRIRTAEDTIVNMPNANLIRAAVENFGERRFRRTKLWLRLSYDCHWDAIEAYSKDLCEAIDAMPETVQGKTLVELNDPTDVSLGLLVQCRVEVENYMAEMGVRNRILQTALQLREKHGIVFAPAPRPLPPTPPQEDGPAKAQLA